MLQKYWQKTRQFPVVLLFFAFLFGFSLFDLCWPDRDFSELENRKLEQSPRLTLASLVSESDPWTAKYSSYVKDQFALRDSWIDLKSRAEGLLLIR